MAPTGCMKYFTVQKKKGAGLAHVLDKKQKILFFRIIDFFRITKLHVHLGFPVFRHRRIYIFILIDLCSLI
jgi:hypothetical protein